MTMARRPLTGDSPEGGDGLRAAQAVAVGDEARGIDVRALEGVGEGGLHVVDHAAAVHGSAGFPEAAVVVDDDVVAGFREPGAETEVVADGARVAMGKNDGALCGLRGFSFRRDEPAVQRRAVAGFEVDALELEPPLGRRGRLVAGGEIEKLVAAVFADHSLGEAGQVAVRILKQRAHVVGRHGWSGLLSGSHRGGDEAKAEKAGGHGD